MEAIDQDNYAALSGTLSKTGWLQDLMLRGARRSVLEMLERAGARSVLDVCSGAGTLAHLMSRRGMQVQAVDGSATMAQLARDRYGVISRVVQAEGIRYQRQFDAAVIGLALHEMAEAQRRCVWERMEAAVKNTGLIVVVDYSVPAESTLLSRLSGRVVATDEHRFEALHPEHARNYTQFMQQGGLLGWLRQRNSRIYQVRHHLFGNLAVVAVMK